MTGAVLPALKWRPSPNFYANLNAPVHLLVAHDCEGGYNSAVNTFLQATPGHRVSAHFVLKEDGSEVTQMVSCKDAAWHVAHFNKGSLGFEMAGFEAKGFSDAEWKAEAALIAYFCHLYKIPVQWSRKGMTPGICRHLDLGAAGGGHSDPTKDVNVWLHFMDQVEAAYNLGGFPATYAHGEPAHPAIPLAKPVPVA